MLLPHFNFRPTALAGSMRELGLYAALVLLLPGGSLIALVAWAVRHRRRLARG